MSFRLVRFARLAALLSLAAVAACQSVDLAAAYDHDLAHWQGATRAQLLADWGEPMLERPDGPGTALVFVGRADMPARPSTPVVVQTPAGPAVVTQTTHAPRVPADCTTTFLLRDDRVVSWRFEGVGCGAPR